MKFTCEKAVFLSAISIASRTVSPKSTIPVLEGLLIEAGQHVTVTGYNLKTGIRTKFDADISNEGSIALNSKLLGEIVRKMPDDLVSFSCDSNNMVKLSCGMSKFELIGTSAEDFPELPMVEQQNSVYVTEGVLKSVISETIFAVSDNETKPVHTGSLFEISGGVLTVVSVDGFRLALRREKLEDSEAGDSSFVVPSSALSEVEKIALDKEELVKITLGAKHIMFSLSGTELISRRLEGEFLDYKKSIPTVSKYMFFADKRPLTEAVERVSLLINEKNKAPLRCVFGDNLVSLHTATALGRADDECELNGDGEGLEIGFNNRYLLDALKAVPASEIKILLNSGITPCIIIPADDSDRFLYMILPVRIRPEESY